MRNRTRRVFPPFRLDPANAQLWRDDEEICLRPKTFEVLRYLVEHAGELVTKSTLLDAVWAEVSVSDSMPATCVKELRKALGDEARTPQFIETVHGRGYRFIAQVTTEPALSAIRKSPNVLAKGPQPIMVGREEELARARNWYSQVFKGQRLVIFVAGEAGIGKSTFVQAFLDSITQDGMARLGRGQCVEQYGAGEPYMPVLDALNRLSREPDGDRVIAVLNRFAPTWLAQMPGLLTPEERSRLQSETQGVTQQRMLREMTQALEALAIEAPLVLLLEDLHWSDFSTLELISAIARRIEPARLLIVGTYRPVEMLADDHPLRTMKEELELHHYCEELRLKLLSEEDVAGYLATRFSGDGSPQLERLAPAIHERTEGNPLFMVNVVDYLVDAGLLVNSRDVSAAESAENLQANQLDAPRSIRQMIERNLERLKPEEQAVLESASAVGAEFSAASVAAALERPQTEVEACCAHLSRHEQFVARQGPITWPDGTVATGFRFHHALYQEVLYGRLPAGHRLQLHRRIAAREEIGYGERAGEVATELAHHYSLANVKHKAIQYFRLAGERAVARGAMAEAEEHYRCALKLLSELPQAIERDREELALQMALGGVLWSSKSWSHPETDNAYKRALELGEKLGESTQLVAVLMGLVSSALGSGHFKLGQELGERMLQEAERGGGRAELCAAHTFLGQALIWRAQYADAQKHLELGSSYYDEGDPAGLGAWGINASALLPLAVLTLGHVDRARDLMKKALARAERCADPLRVGAVHMWAGMFGVLLRDAHTAFEHAQALRRMAVNQPVWAGLADIYTSETLLMQAKWEEGIGYLHRAIAFHNTVGLFGLRPWQKLDEAEFLASQGRTDDALALVTDAVADTEELAHLRAPSLRQRATLLARSGADTAPIVAAYREAIECARIQGARYYELQATTDFARWLKSQDRSAEARTLLANIYSSFTEGFDTSALKGATVLLDQLSNRSSAIRRSTKSRTNR